MSAVAYWLAAAKCATGEVYNVGATTGMSIAAALRALEFVAGVKEKRELDLARLRPAEVSYQIPRAGKFLRETGWVPEIRFADSLKWLLDEVRRD